MKTMLISNFLQILLIIITIVIVANKDNIKIVIFFSFSSLITALLYFLNKAPDVALAEVAIGSAIMPLILIISISKQREFVVISHIDDDFLTSQECIGYKLLEDFAKYYNLKLRIYTSDINNLRGIFRENNVDLIVEKSKKSNKYLFKGKKSSILMNKLEQMAKNESIIKIIKVGENETHD